MNCYCYETENEFIFCAENVEPELEDIVEAAWFKKIGNGKYEKVYNRDMEKNGVNDADKQVITSNFKRLGESMFSGVFEWKLALKVLIDNFEENEVRYYVIGSCSEGILGVDINPHDIDIIVHTDDFFRVKDIFHEFIVEPFLDNLGNWVVRYFGRLCIEGAMIDIAADEKMNGENHEYDKVKWNGYDIHIEPLKARYETEVERKREDRIRAIEDYLKSNN